MSSQDLYKKACDAVELASYDYAVELFREVLRQDPQHPDARKVLRGTERRRAQEKGRSASVLTAPLRALATAVKGMFGGARKRLEIYEDYLEKSPNSYWALMNAAAAAAKCDLRDDAIMMYTDAVKLKPNNKRGLRVVSDVLIEAGQSQEALTYLQRLASMEPANRDLKKELRDLEATQHMTSHQMEEAGSFRDLIRDQDEAARLEQGRRLGATVDDLRAQIPDAEKDVAENPEHPGRILGLAGLYADTEQLSKAKELLQEKNKLLPQNYDVREKLGDVQLQIYDRAIAAAQARAERDPADADANTKKEELRKRRNALALREYGWQQQQHPTDRELQLKLARAYFDTGKYNEAIASYQSAAQDSRFAIESARMLGLCFMRKEQFDLALAQFQNAIQRHPEMDEQGKGLLYCEAQAHEEMGNKEQALIVYKKIYSQDIGFRDVAQKVDALSG